MKGGSIFLKGGVPEASDRHACCPLTETALGVLGHGGATRVGRRGPVSAGVASCPVLLPQGWLPQVDLLLVGDRLDPASSRGRGPRVGRPAQEARPKVTVGSRVVWGQLSISGALEDRLLLPFPERGERPGMGLTKAKCNSNPDLGHLEDGTGPPL